MTTITYIGNPDRIDDEGEYSGPMKVKIYDEARNVYGCVKDQPVDVPQEVADRLGGNPYFSVGASQQTGGQNDSTEQDDLDSVLGN